MDTINIVEVDRASKNIFESLKKLLPQLTTNFKPFDHEYLEEIVGSDSTRLFIAQDSVSDNYIVGTYAMVIFYIPTGSIARIEDVIVDELYRGKGIGRMMMEHAINYIKKRGITKIELTSHPSRIAANSLYQTLGFTRIETNVYRYKT